MVGRYRLVRDKHYPRPHDINAQFVLGIDDAAANCTIIPAIHHDEAILPSSIYTNPEHASFAETADSNCSADSKIFGLQATLRVTLSKAALETDSLHAMRFAFMSIHGAFEDFDATDELTSVSVGDVLELTKETTDRQTYPIYNGTDLVDKFTNSAHLGTNAQGLTTDTGLENVAFDPDLYYDALNYYTISEKLKKVQDGLRWITLTRDNPTKLIKFNMKSDVKSMNPYAFLGHMIYAPPAGTKYQMPIAGDTSAISHLHIEYRARYLEWNDNYNHQRA